MDNCQRIICVSGDIGSGKSTVARMLARRLDVPFYSTGAIQREIAASKGMSTLELNIYSERHPEVDREIDSFTERLGSQDRPAVIDSRMAWFFVPNGISINLSTDPLVAATRVMGDRERGGTEAYSAPAEAARDIIARRKSEQKRFARQYGVDCLDPRNFDINIDTSGTSQARTMELILRTIEECHGGPCCWLWPKGLYPTQGTRGLAAKEAQGGYGTNGNNAVDGGPGRGEDIKVIYASDGFFIFDGHSRVSRGIQRGDSLIRANLLAAKDQRITGGLSVDDYVKVECSLSKVYDWEAYHSFRFSAYPAHLQAIRDREVVK